MSTKVESTQTQILPTIDPERLPAHVAIIMDGNGRWARQRTLNRVRGHEVGTESVREIVRASKKIGIRWLTLYAFSSDNWGRPAAEVSVLMKLFRRYLRTETPELVQNGVRLRVVGRRDRLDPGLVRAIERAEEATGNGARLLLRLAVDYSARDLIVETVRRAATASDVERHDLANLLGLVMHGGGPAPELPGRSPTRHVRLMTRLPPVSVQAPRPSYPRCP